MTIQELRDQYAKLMAEANQVIDDSKGKITAEVRSKYEAILADAGNLAFVIEKQEAEEKRALENRGKNLQLPGVGEHAAGNPETRNKEVKESFLRYMRTGQVETRDLTAAANGILVPQLFNPSIYEAEKSYGELATMVTTMNTTSGDPMKLVYDNDTTHGLVAVSSGTDVSEVDPTTSSATLSVDNFSTGVIKVDFALLQDAGFDVDSWIKNRFAERYYRGLANLIYNGNPAGSPPVAGAVASLASAYTTGFTTASTGTLAYADFAKALATLDPAYHSQAVWAMSNETLGYVVGLTDSVNGRPLFLPNFGSADQGFAGTILGKPVKLVTQMPAVATGNAAVLFGDFKKGYTVRTVGGLGILRLNERYAAGFEVGFVGFARIGGVATNYGASPIIAATIK